MATLLAHLKIKEGREAEYEAIQARLYRETHGREPDVRRYEFFRGPGRGEYYGLLSYDDFVGFMEHQSSDHHEAFTAPFRELVEESSIFWIDPIGSASDLTPTDPQPLPEGASQLMRDYAKMFAIEVPDWWQQARGRAERKT
ncbi:MAG: hypothetical protein RIC56_10460 [Pseudomonadales bacterium]